jgi:ABC-type transport system involved in multi-copper enzyme maturation permease subunit
MSTDPKPKKSSHSRALWHAVLTLQARASQSTLNSLGIYITLAAGLLTASLVVHNNLRYTERSLIFVTLEPLFLPILVNLALVAVYLAVTSSISIARERDRGTLEVLLYGPVDETAFILSVFVAQLKIYVLALLVTLVWANLITWLLHLLFSPGLLLMLLTSVIMAGGVIAFGILTAAWGGRARTALVYFFLVVLFLVAVQAGDQVVSSLVITTGQSSPDSLLLLRNTLAFLSNALQWISPISQLTLAMDALADRSVWPYFMHLGVLLAQLILLLGAAVSILRRKGGRG